MVVFVSWTGLESLDRNSQLTFIKNFNENRISLLDSAGNKYVPRYSATVDVYMWYQQSGRDLAQLQDLGQPRDWVVWFTVPRESQNFTLIIKNPDPQEGQPRLAAVLLGQQKEDAFLLKTFRTSGPFFRSHRYIDCSGVFPPLCLLQRRHQNCLASRGLVARLGIINWIRRPRASVSIWTTRSLRFSLFLRSSCKETLDGENRHGRGGLFLGFLWPLRSGLI